MFSSVDQLQLLSLFSFNNGSEYIVDHLKVRISNLFTDYLWHMYSVTNFKETKIKILFLSLAGEELPLNSYHRNTISLGILQIFRTPHVDSTDEIRTD